MGEKEIFYNILSREIDNLMGINPTLGFLSGPVKNWLFRYIDPYVNLFLREQGDLQVDVASAFLKEEISSKIDKFKQQFKEEINDQQI